MRITAFIVGILTATALFFYSPYLLKDNPAKASYWIPKVFTYQDQLLAKRDNRPKLVVIAGSNGIYGYDGNYLEKYSNFDVVNMAVHIGFDLRLYKNRLAGKLKRGDVVIAPLEHALYRRKATTGFHQKQNLLWMQRFFNYDSAYEKLRYNLETPLDIYADLAWQKLTGKPRDLTGLADLENDGIKTPRVLPARKPLHVSLADKDGFFNIPLATDEKLKETFAAKRRPYSNLPLSAATNTPAIEALLELKASVEAQGAEFYLTWPAMADIPSHSRYDTKLVNGYRQFQAKLKQTGLDLICDPAKNFMPVKYFSDTVYHANSWGAIDRSIKLAQCLKRLDGDRFQFARVVDQHTVKNQLSIRNMRQNMLAPFEVARRDLNKLVVGLENYYRDNGNYPVSSNNGRGWDGPRSKWGERTDLWIKGLVPKYVDALPRDWRNSKSVNYQYLYKSNGKVFKMMNRRPPDCELAKSIVPEFSDVARKCWAYGVYRGYAKTW